jgi:hypothetical protein
VQILATTFLVSLDGWQMDGKAKNPGAEKSSAEKGIILSVPL